LGKRVLVKLRFLGGKRAPGGYGKNKPLVVGEIYELTERHALFPWFERVDKKAEPDKVPAATEDESVFEKKTSGEDESAEFEKAFRTELVSNVGQVPINMEKKKKVVPEAGAGSDVALDVETTRKKYERLTKKELLKIITDQGGVADEGMLKAMLVEIALSKGS